MGLLIFLFLVINSVIISNLLTRVKRLEELTEGKGVIHQKKYLSNLNESIQEKSFNSTTTPLQTIKLVNSPQKDKLPSFEQLFFEWLKEDWLLKAGAILIIIGFGWLTTYAFLNNWIGPMGRIALGIITGTLFIIFGWWRMKKYANQGGIFLILGSTIILLTTFAARQIYGFFTPFSALFVMFLSTAFVGLASVRYNSRALSLASLILASLAPFLTNSPTNNYVALFFYLLIVILGTIWIAIITHRQELSFAALIITTFYSLPHLLSLTSADHGVLLLFAYAFTGIFFLTDVATLLKSKGKNIIPSLIIAIGNGLFLLAWISIAAPDEWQSLIISTWMIVFAVGAFLIFQATKKRELFYIYGGVGISMLAAATAAELQGATLIIAYTIESALIAIVSYLLLQDIKISQRISLLLIVPVFMSLNSIKSSAWLTSIFHKDFFVLLILTLTIFGIGLFFLSRTKETVDEKPQQFNIALLIIGSIYAYILLWLSLHAVFANDNTAVILALTLYTIVGLFTYLYGITNNKKGLYLYGGILVGFVVARLLLLDIWKMAIAGRIVTFFLIGTLLISTAFLKRKKHS